jgi:hypothetical protein
LFFIGYFPYGWAIIRDRHKDDSNPNAAKPSKTSWIIWISLDALTGAGMYFSGALNGQMIGTLIGGFVILILALIYGRKGWTRLDVACFSGAAIGIALWAWSGDPRLGIIASCATGFIGSFPTFRSAWRMPNSEDKTAWVLFSLSCVCADLAIPHLTIEDALQPLTFSAIEAIVTTTIFIRPLFLRQRTA